MFATNRRFAVTGGNTLVSSPRTGGNTVTGSHRPRDSQMANMMPFMMGGQPTGANVRMTAAGPIAANYMLTGLVPDHEELLRRYYRDIYLHDSVSGSVVDIMSTFPFSDWSLTGADVAILKKYEESVARLNMRSLLPEMSVAYLVDGEFIGTLVFNSENKVFVDVMIHPADKVRREDSPFYSADPKFTVINDETTRKFMASDSPFARSIRATFSEKFCQALQGSAYELNPATTLYLARRTLPSRPPTSFLRRVLPFYLLEKTLFRGTLVEVNRRQRAMAHVTVGSDLWEPTAEELDAIVGIFQQAELDPLGAIVATRNDVQINEVRPAGDFLKWNDMLDQLVPHKLRALGTSEAFLSQDANFSNAETAMSVFMESADSYRQYITYKTFTNKIFPTVAVTNGFFKDPAQTKKHNLDSYQALLNNYDNLIIPNVVWNKQLEQRQERDPIDVLDKLEEKGFPVPLRMWAAAGNVRMDTLLYELEQDAEFRSAFSKFKAATGQEQSLQGNDDLDTLELSAMPQALAHRKRPLLSREFSAEESEIKTTTKTGKLKAVYDQKGASKKANAMIAKAVKALSDPNVRAAALKRAKRNIK